MAIQVAQTPRKKFSLHSEVSLALRRYNLQTKADGNGWRVSLDKAIAKKVCLAYHDKFLYVNGSVTEQYDLNVQTIPELLEYLKLLPPPTAVNQPTHFRRLKSVPLFSGVKKPNNNNGRFALPDHNYTDSDNVLLKKYNECELHHKVNEGHHPDGLGWRAGIPATIECVFDIFNSLLRTNSLISAYNKMFAILLDDKFTNLDLKGIFYAFLHISIRGVSNPEMFYTLSNWRRETVSQELLFKVSHDFANGITPRSLIAAYIAETQYHMSTMNAEMRRLRMPNVNHDHTKMQPEMIYYYTWRWGIYARFDEVNRHRFNSGIYETVQQRRSRNIVEAQGECNPTMFTVGSSIGKGLSESPAVLEVISLLKQLPDKIGERVDRSLEIVDEKLEKHQTILKDNITEVSEESTKRAEKISDVILEKVVQKSSALGDNIMKSFSPIVEALNSFRSVIEGVISNVMEFLKPVPGFSKLTINAQTIFDGLVYYVLYINTPSTAIKTILAVLILKTFGLLQTAYAEILRFWSWTQNEVEIDGKICSAKETSGGVFDWIINSPSALIKIIGGLISTIAKGVPLSMGEFMSLSKQLAEKLKNFHFIAQGISGLGKIFDYFRKAYEITAEWISVHIFGKTPEKELYSKQAIKLMIKIKYFHTEAGMNAIRVNEAMRKQAEEILAEYLSLQATFKDKREYRHLFNDLEKLNRQVKEVSDFVTRLRSMSNFQPTMFHMQFVGRPGIGKSTITKNVVSDLSRTLWPEEPKASFYSYNTDLEYFDGYAGQKIMIVDDLYKINDPKHLTTSMFLVTNTPVILPMANLNDKGVQLTSEVLLSSTNTAYPIGKDVLCMEAIHRRRHMLVEVVCDPEVLDQSLGQFSMALYKLKYKVDDLPKFPHLKFNLLRPVPKEFGGAMTVDANEFEVYKDYAAKLKEANIKIAMGDRRVDPMYYFSEDNRPPPGISLPATGWTYEQLISNCAVRFAAFRGAEGTYTTQRKFIHVEHCFSEIDALLDQNEDIPDGQQIPITKAIEKLLCKAQHPFGSTDPVGEKLNIEKEKVSPELSNIDFDKIVEDIINEHNPTNDNLDLEQERARTQNILRRRGRTVADPILRDQLKILHMDGKKLIPIMSHFTAWYEPPVVHHDNIGMVLGYLTQKGYLSKYELQRIQDVENPSWIRSLYYVLKESGHQVGRDTNNFLKWALSERMVIPAKPEIFGEHAGQTTNLPIAFFKDMIYQGNQWYLDVTNLAEVDGYKAQEVFMVPYEGGPKYKVKMDFAFFLSTSRQFRAFAAEFDAMTLDQQRLLVEDARWRFSYTGSYSYEYLAEQCTNIFGKISYKTMHYLTSPMKNLAERYPLVLSIVAYAAIYATVIYLMTKLSEMFQPQPTSKHLHKAPQSSMLFHGRPTAQNANLYEIAKSIVSRSVREVVISDSNCGSKVQALFSEQYIIMNKHCLKYIKDNEILISVQSTSPDKEFIRYIINKENIYQDPDGDLAIIYSQNFPAMRKVTQHLVTEEEYIGHDFPEDLVFLSNSKFGVIIDHHTGAVKYQNLKLRNKQYQNIIDEAILVKGSTMAGRSGSPVITTVQNRPRIVGIQAWEVDAAVSPKIAIQIITDNKFKQLKDALLNQLKISPIERTEEPDVCEVDGCETSAFQQVDPESIITDDSHYVGQVASSQIKPSIIYDDLSRLGITTDSVPAALNRYDQRLFHGTKIHPLAHSLGKYFRGNIEPFQPAILDYCAQNLSNYIRTKLDKRNFKILTFEEAITGTREDGSNPMNLKSSPGIPFIFEQHKEKGKRPYVQLNEDGEVDYINQDFLEQYNQFLDELKQRKVPYTRSYDFPKDELRPAIKALGSETTPPKTRSVTCMNMFYIIAWRQITLDFWATMHRAANGTMPFCPGINPEGPEWNALYHTLNKHPNAVDFDVSNWDGFLRSDLFYKTCDIVKQQCKLSSEYSNVIDSIAYEVMNSFIQFGNIIYQKGRGLVSGFPGTAEINSLSHWLLILYIYMLLTSKTPYNTFAAFNTHVSCAIYGDDILLTFSDEIKEIFNGITIAEVYRKIGYPVTSADKNLEIQKTKQLLECTFLKSTWRELFPHYYVRKMDQNVIHNLVLWVRSRQDPKQQFYENYMDALRLAFSSGPSVFYKFRECVNLALARSGRDIIAFDYLDFERDYMQRYVPEMYTNNHLYI